MSITRNIRLYVHWDYDSTFETEPYIGRIKCTNIKLILPLPLDILGLISVNKKLLLDYFRPMPLCGWKCLFKFSKWVLSMHRGRLNLQPVSFAIYTWLVCLSHNLPPYFECAKSRIISKLLSLLKDLHRVFALIPELKKRKKSK